MKNNFFYSLLRTPVSLEKIFYDENNYCLMSTNQKFELVENIPIIFSEKKQTQVISWWTDLYKQLYEKLDFFFTSQNINYYLDRFHDLMKINNHLIINEMLIENIKNKLILEIGSGSGAHSALLSREGAKVCAIDISLARSISTNKKLKLLNNNSFLSINCDAEELPLESDSFDFIYSNGVLHHSDNPQRAINEVYRVLKPKGKAIIMLYCKSSAEFFFNIIPRAIIFGSIFRKKKIEEWVGQVTEGKPKFGFTKNPITNVYTKTQLEKLFKNFEIISIRKSAFYFKDFCIPRLTQLRELILTILGYNYHDGGKIVYGRDFMPQTKLELLLSPHFGFCWNLVVKKN